MDCAFNDDKDWQPADGEDGSSSCFEDEECSLEDEECSEGRLSKVPTTRKRVQLSAGPMSAILQEQPQPQVQAKRVRCHAAPMSATLQPSPTISQDQHENQSVQLQAQPQALANDVGLPLCVLYCSLCLLLVKTSMEINYHQTIISSSHHLMKVT